MKCTMKLQIEISFPRGVTEGNRCVQVMISSASAQFSTDSTYLWPSITETGVELEKKFAASIFELH